ncbi:MAG TPA: alpha/beta hydrolase [Cyclobacteriaceae bacterium]|nr:alpha/beta hydrolase [Cyclobacteriaceae bacterium]
MSRKTVFITFPIILLIAVYFLGPTPHQNVWSLALPAVPQDPAALESFVAANEAKHKIKTNNEARIVWFDSTKNKTPYSVVYLHGFTASQEEGDPVHIDFAKKFGCNLYLARLADHGIDTTEQLMNFTGDRFWESAKEAMMIGKAIGDKVILVSTSTGGTVALVLAGEYPDDVHALINLSPNIAVNNETIWIANNPWGLQIARKVVGGNYQVVTDFTEERKQYWNATYRLESVSALQQMIEEKMNKSTFGKVKCPSLTLYYYKDDSHQDPTVKVSAILEMNSQLGTPADMRVEKAIPGADAHVIGSSMTSKDLPAVEAAIDDFAIQKLKMSPVTSSTTLQ